ncbi:MAG: bifunctional nuclease family protein [Candidatus Hydrothermales bacterium]
MKFFLYFFIFVKFVEVEVFEVIPQGGGGYTLVLRKVNSESLLFISIGENEGLSIIRALNKVNLKRPLTYDLMKNIIYKLGAKVEKVTIDKFEKDTYFASIHLRQGNRKIVVDARPSDAINLAIREKVKIYVNEKVFEKMKIDLEKKEEKEGIRL